ncbi:MAG TPA: diguanylate cyclase [Terriglobales bacterium]
MTQVHPSVREVAVLQQATQMILSSLDADTVLHHMMLVVRNYFGATRAAVYLVDNISRDLFCRSQLGYEHDLSTRRYAVGKESVAGWAAFTRAPLYVPDASKETRHRIDEQNVRSVLALPLLVRERAVGVLEIGSDKVDPFSNDAISLLSVFAGQAAIALENARLYSTDLRRMRQIEIINLIARTAATANDAQQFYTLLADLISDTFEGTMIAIVLCSPEAHLSVAAQAGDVTVQLGRFVASRERGLLAEAFSNRSLALVNDIANRAEWPACFPEAGSELCAPMVSLGEVLGAIVLGHTQAHFFGPDDRTIAQAAADVCATAARNVQLTDELRRVMNIDPLTGIHNQHYFHTALAQEIPRSRRHKKEFGLVMMDIHGFHKINADLGLESGDEILRRVATALKAGLRNNDVVSRYLGDRFAILLPEISGEGLAVVVGKLSHNLQAIEVPYPGAPEWLAASWAAVQYPIDATEELDLMKALLARLETAKKQSAGAGA